MSEPSSDASALSLSRPANLTLSPSSSYTSLKNHIRAECDGAPSNSELGCYTGGDVTTSYGNPMMMKLMKEYAEKDGDYVGLEIVSPLDEAIHSCPKLYFGDNNNPTDYDDTITKDGLTMMLSEKEKDQSKEICLFIYHLSGDPSPGKSILSLDPDQSPHLLPIYSPHAQKFFGSVIQYTDEDYTDHISPGTRAVRVESKTHVYLALDYTREDDPKLITVKEPVMESSLKELNQGSDIKIKPIVNVKIYQGTAGFNTTALYFKTEKNYYFVYVDESTLHLKAKKEPITNSKAQKNLYLKYLNFGPKIFTIGSSGGDEVDGSSVEKSSTTTGNPNERKESFESSLSDSSPDGSSPLRKVKMQLDASAVDSGVDTIYKNSQDSEEEAGIAA